MAVASAPQHASVSGATPKLPESKSERLMSLDVFRGLTMLLLISHGFGIREALQGNVGMAWLSDQFEHAAWVGCTLWDLIQPAFTFIVGVAIPLSVARRAAQGATKSEVFRHVLWRAFALLVLSNVLSNFNNSAGRPLRLQFINVLCQIAFSYVLCYLILQLRFRWQAVAAGALMIAHHALFYLFPGPDGPYSQAGNVGAQLDHAILGYTYSGYYTTLNFMGNAITVLFGVWTGMLLAHYQTHRERVRILAACSAGAFALGLALAPFIPMVKRLWLGSFTFFSAGWVLLFFLACYYAIEVRGHRGSWMFPAVVMGTNCIFIYSFSQVLHGWMSRGIANFDGNKFAFLGSYGAIPHNIVVLGVMWYMCYWLYQRRIFFKL